MPNYTFEDTETGEQFVEFMPMDSKEQFLEDNPHLKFVFVPIGLPGDHMMGVGPKPDSGFTESMQRISEAHPGSPLADRFGSNESNAKKSARKVVRKHMKK